MTSDELIELRREKWRLNGVPIRTLEDARSFVESAGFCLTYPSRPALLLPTFHRRVVRIGRAPAAAPCVS